MPNLISQALCALATAVLFIPAAAVGDSAFLLPYPSEFGPIPARATLDDGSVLPEAQMAMEAQGEDRVTLTVEAGDPAGASLSASALLEVVGHGAERSLRILRQRSVSRNPAGHALPQVDIDHHARRARCLAQDGSVLGEVALDARDRMVQVPMNLFLRPLVAGERDTLKFEVLLCRGKVRKIAFKAWVDSRDDTRGVRVRYAPDFGIASALVQRMAPDLRFWFTNSAPYAWVGHKLPLYTDGPAVTVLRSPVAAGLAGATSR